MSDRRKDLLTLLLLFVILTLFFSKILFTDKIIRAPDIINEFYWWVMDLKRASFGELVQRLKLTASWDIYTNGGTTDEGGNAAGSLHFYRSLLFHFLPAPASVAWFIVLHLFFGAAGVYCYCRLIGTSRPAAALGGLVFALAPENASLINAGHVIKIATICFAPWAFWGCEKAFQSRRLFWFMATGVILAFQFFGGHWQISFYTCLGIGAYGVVRSLSILRVPDERRKFPVSRLLGLNLVLMAFFLSTVAISLAPLAKWSTDTNRGVQSGANQGKGGLDREEAMSWSLPPEELGALVIPGFFGLSRQEGGENPTNIASYYWGRMVFTQTVSYLGLLPWLLVPLPLIFRRDRYTWLAVIGILGGLLFSMGKYTPFYNLLYDHFPGINRFRVPKMMMFIPLLGLAVLAARGLDLLRDERIRTTRGFRRYLVGLMALPLALLLMLASQLAAPQRWLNWLADLITQPNRFEQGPQLVSQRWNNLVHETAVATGFAACCAAALFAYGRRWLSARVLLALLLVLYLADVWRINDKFMFLIPVPATSHGGESPVTEFLGKEPNQYRVLPMNGTDPMYYATRKIPVMFTSNPVQKRRWQEFLDTFVISSAMPDILNVRYLIYSADQYAREKAQLGDKFQPVFTAPDGKEIVLENRTVLSKAWLVPAVVVLSGAQQALAALQSPMFDPRRIATVESPPPIPLAGDGGPAAPPGQVTVSRYEGERISLTAKAHSNALLVLGEKYYQGWRAAVDGKQVPIVPVDHVLRGLYLTPGEHRVEFVFDPTPFKVGKYLTLASFAVFAIMLVRERRRRGGVEG
jgi:membrane protein YfhO